MTHQRVNAVLAWFLATALAFGSSAALVYALTIAAIELLGLPLSLTGRLWLVFLFAVLGVGLPFHRRLENFLRRAAFDIETVEAANRLADGDEISDTAQDALARQLADEIRRR